MKQTLPRELQSLIEIENPSFTDPKGLVKSAQKIQAAQSKIGIKYKEVFVVLDFTTEVEIEQSLHLAKKSNIRFAYTRICIEFWFFLHFERKAKSFNMCAEVIRFLENNHIIGYHKTKIKHFELLLPNLKTALENAKWLEEQKEDMDFSKKNPYTNMHEMIEIVYEYLQITHFEQTPT